MGISIFRRTSKGVAPTEKGEEFLLYAKKILTQIERMEALHKPASGDCQRFSICIPTGSYISHAFTHFVSELSAEKDMDIRIKESNSLETINSVANGEFNLGIVRLPSHYSQYFQEYFKEKDLLNQLIWEYDYLVLMSREHPLAAAEEVTYQALGSYIEISHEEIAVPYLQTEEIGRTDYTEHDRRRISVHERSSQFDMLSLVKTAYMWVSPVPEEMLGRYNLVQRRCRRDNHTFQDVLVYPKDYTLTLLDRKFIDTLFVTKNQVAFLEYC